MTASYRSELLVEIHRCLGQSGLFVNADKYPPDDDQERYELLREWVLHNVADHSPERVMKIGEAMADLGAIGFTDVKEVYRHGLEAVVVGVK
jgi:hypothetical protein